MIQIPADLAKLYTSFVEQKGVETTSIDIILRGSRRIMRPHFFMRWAYLSGRKTRNDTSYGKSAARMSALR